MTGRQTKGRKANETKNGGCNRDGDPSLCGHIRACACLMSTAALLREYMSCLSSGEVCMLPADECPTNYLWLRKTEYERWYCPGIGYLYELTGSFCACYDPNPM